MIAPLAVLVLAAGRIKHVVVLYEENRAFDHFFGHQKALKVDGLKGNETNPIDYKHPSKGSVKVFDGAPYVAKEQPRHGYSAYQTKFDIVDGYPRMDGFVTYERSVHPLSHKTADAVMQGFTDGALPISTALASEFAVFDKWYAAFPGPSWPNHMMSMSATSNGGTNTGDGYQCKKGAKYPQRTIFDNLLAAGHEYARIYNDSVVELYLESFNSDAAFDVGSGSVPTLLLSRVVTGTDAIGTSRIASSVRSSSPPASRSSSIISAPSGSIVGSTPVEWSASFSRPLSTHASMEERADSSSRSVSVTVSMAIPAMRARAWRLRSSTSDSADASPAAAGGWPATPPDSKY